jgi:ribosomal protein L19
MISLKKILKEETILVRRVDGDGAEKFLKKYPKVKQIMTTLAQKNTDLMRGYKAFLKFKDKQEDYLGGRAEQTTSATFGSKTFYKYDWNNLKGHWPEVYQYIYTLRYGGLDGAKVESVNETSFQKGKTYGGTKCEGGCYMGKDGLKKIIKISKDNPKNTFMFRDDNYSGLQPHFIKNGVIAKANTVNASHDLERYKVRSLNIGKDVILSVRLFESTNESINEAKSDYEVYHKSYTSAIQAAKAYAEKKGYEINDDDSFRQIGMGPRKPSEGKTNKFSIELSKDGKVQRKKLQIQVYGMRNSYELNAYIQ